MSDDFVLLILSITHLFERSLDNKGFIGGADSGKENLLVGHAEWNKIDLGQHNMDFSE